MEREVWGEFDDIEVELVEGEHGVFDIFLDETLIFSKGKGSCCRDRFPRPQEIPGIIKRLT
ncbi:MAG: Rdx family protein [bacterium]|nr:MAG: Rdx family protein [bacterium]